MASASLHIIGNKIASYGTVIKDRLPDGRTIGNITRYSNTSARHQKQVDVYSCDVTVDNVPQDTIDLIGYYLTDHDAVAAAIDACYDPDSSDPIFDGRSAAINRIVERERIVERIVERNAEQEDLMTETTARIGSCSHHSGDVKGELIAMGYVTFPWPVTSVSGHYPPFDSHKVVALVTEYSGDNSEFRKVTDAWIVEASAKLAYVEMYPFCEQYKNSIIEFLNSILPGTYNRAVG